MRAFAMALAIFTLALNARANTITWSYTGGFNHIDLEEYAGVTKLLTDNIVQITAYIIWDYEEPLLGNKETIINQLRDGSFDINGTAKEIAGIEEVTPDDLTEPHSTILVNLGAGSNSYILDIIFLLQLNPGVVPDHEYLWYDPKHLEHYHKGDSSKLYFSVGDFIDIEFFIPIPEPAAGLLVALGGAVLLFRRKRAAP